MTKRHKKNRFHWVKQHRQWTARQWDSIIWSDESRFEVCVGDSRSKVLRRRNEEFHPDCLREKVKFAPSLMVWGCMSAHGVGDLHFIDGTVNAEKYIDILENNLLPSIERLPLPFGEYIFQQDSAPCHTAKKVKNWMSENGIPLLDWVASSPDLSPIETLWGEMKKELRKNPARTKEELRVRLQEIWDNFTPEFCQGLVDTMPRRIESVIKNKGNVTQW